MSYTASLKFVPVSRQIKDIITLCLPKGGVIFDPTCGEEGYQLQEILKRQHDSSLDAWLSKKKKKEPKGPVYKFIRSDLKPTGDLVASVKHLPLRDNTADFTIYDPPFVPRSRSDERAQDYGIDEAREPQDIFAFYGSEIMKELARVTKSWLAIRGSDFYHPPSTCNFYAFSDFALRHYAEAGLIYHGIWSYKQVNPKHGIYRKQIQKQLGLPRPIISHTYIAVLRKEGAI